MVAALCPQQRGAPQLSSPHRRVPRPAVVGHEEGKWEGNLTSQRAVAMCNVSVCRNGLPVSVRQSPKDRQSDRYAPVLLESPTQPGPGVIPSSGEPVSYGPLWDYEATPNPLLPMVCDGRLRRSTAFVSRVLGHRSVWHHQTPSPVSLPKRPQSLHGKKVNLMIPGMAPLGLYGVVRVVLIPKHLQSLHNLCFKLPTLITVNSFWNTMY